MSKSNVASNQQALHDDLQKAVKSLLAAPTALKTSDYSKVLASSLAATQKTVTIQIDSSDLAMLKQNDYKLCFAKKVGNEAYNVVWESYGQYLAFNDFSWTPQYQLFGSNQFQDNMIARASTNTVNISLGQQATLDSNGNLGAAVSGGPETGITLINNYGSIHPGLNQLSTGINGSQVSTPIYVAPNTMVTGQTTLTPVEIILVWFEQGMQTSTLFSVPRSNAIEIDLTATSSASRLYVGGVWKTV